MLSAAQHTCSLPSPGCARKPLVSPGQHFQSPSHCSRIHTTGTAGAEHGFHSTLLLTQGTRCVKGLQKGALRSHHLSPLSSVSNSSADTVKDFHRLSLIISNHLIHSSPSYCIHTPQLPVDDPTCSMMLTEIKYCPLIFI